MNLFSKIVTGAVLALLAFVLVLELVAGTIEYRCATSVRESNADKAWWQGDNHEGLSCDSISPILPWNPGYFRGAMSAGFQPQGLAGFSAGLESLWNPSVKDNPEWTIMRPLQDWAAE